MFTLDYSNLLTNILSYGYKYKDPNREGVYRLEVFPAIITHDMSKSFPLLASKKMFTRGIFVELLWMLSGRTDLNFLIDRGIHVWDKDAYNYAVKNGYTESFDKFIDEVKSGGYFNMGPLYGKQWRKSGNVDQLLNVINNLLDDSKKYSSALIINSWNVSELHKMALPPCHHEIQFNCRPCDSECEEGCRGYLDLQFSMRSSDVLLGLPWNFAFYAMLLLLIAKITNMKPGLLTYFGKKVHIYDNQILAAKETINKTNIHHLEFMKEPDYKVYMEPEFLLNEYTSETLNVLIDSLNLDTIQFENYMHTGNLQYQPEMLAYNS